MHTGDIELVLPASVAEYGDYKGLWIHTDHFESIGVKRGDLAILVSGKVERGELVAVADKKTEAVSCGFYDSEFGIVCLDLGDGEPMLFDSNDVEILGKVIGTSTGKPDVDGKTHVRPLRVS